MKYFIYKIKKINYLSKLEIYLLDKLKLKLNIFFNTNIIIIKIFKYIKYLYLI